MTRRTLSFQFGFGQFREPVGYRQGGVQWNISTLKIGTDRDRRCLPKLGTGELW